MKRWSKLKKRIENLLIPEAEVFLFKYRMDSERGSTDLPVFQIKKSKEILFEFPKDFKNPIKNLKGQAGGYYPYDFPDFTGMLHTYIETNPQQLTKLDDKLGLYKILVSLDRRFHGNI
jgi:hypothetical protein